MPSPRPVAPRVVYVAASTLGTTAHRDRICLPELSEAIARAATVDPLFADEASGAEATASILLAIAWHASRLSPYSRDGAFLGAYRMRPPREPPVPAHMFLLPAPASYFAIDLTRRSLLELRDRPLEERLALFRATGRTGGRETRAASERRIRECVPWSRAVVTLARQLFQTRLGKESDGPLVRVPDRGTERAPERRNLALVAGSS